MTSNPLLRVLIVLLIAIATLFLIERVWQIGTAFSDIILLFFLAWLLSFVLSPVVEWLSDNPAPDTVTGEARLLLGLRIRIPFGRLQLPRGWAVVIVYSGLLLATLIAGIILVPLLVDQLVQLAARLPHYLEMMPDLIGRLQGELTDRGLAIDLTDVYQSEQVTRRLESVGTAVIQNALGIATGVASILANVFVILILSFYMNLDRGQLLEQVLKVVPRNYQDECLLFASSVDRTFGGFIRGQLIQSLLFGLGTLVVTWVAGMRFTLVASSLAGLLLLIPLIGIPLSLIPPVIIAAFQAPSLALWIGIILLVWQQIIVNVIMPRVMSEMVGMHPLLIFAALMVGIRVAGFWGAFFGVPVAGVIQAMAVSLYERIRSGQGLSG